MTPAELSRQLREGGGRFLGARRRMAGLTLAASASMGLISLYQLGAIKALPDLPFDLFDANKVDASDEAYAYFATPDGVLGLANYAATLTLIAAGGRDRAAAQPWLPLALAAKVALDAVAAGKLTVDQWTKHRAFCIWCLLAAGATFANLPLALPEARAALRALRGQSATIG